MLDAQLEQLHVCTPPHSSGSFPVIQQSQGGAELSTRTAMLANAHQTGLILLFTSQSCRIVFNKQHFSL